jgi:hypothetical protein
MKKFSAIFWDAANKYLWDGCKAHEARGPLRICSCDAISQADSNPNFSRERLNRGLWRLGLDPDYLSVFHEFAYGPSRQGARYAWLMFCYDLALEQGL